MDILEDADVEQVIIDVLAPTFVISTSIPDNPKPAEFLRVVAGGGSSPNIVTASQVVALEAFAPTETRARAMLVRAVGILEATARSTGSLAGATCYGVKRLTTPQNFPMPTVPTHRRYFISIAPDLRRVVSTI